MTERRANRRPRLLIVDDSRLIVRMVADFFAAQGYEVLTAADGTDALERVRTITPDIIVADILMPNMDGWRLFEEVRKLPETKELPFLFLTVERELPKRLKGFKVGADDYITKPFEVEELHARVERTLARRRLARTPKGGPDALLAGSVEHLSMSDLLQVLSVNGKDCIVHLCQGDRQGSIRFAGGHVVHAECGGARGLKALFRMLAWSRASFHVEATRSAPAERTIEGATSNVVMDGLVSLDEWNRWRAGLPNPDTVLRLSPDAKERIDNGRVRPAEFDVIARSKEGRSIARILEDSPLPDGQIAQAICSLLERGILNAAK